METFTAFCEIVWWNDNEKTEEQIILTEIPDFVTAMTKIEAYYGNDLHSCKITLVGSSFLLVSDKEIYSKLMEENRNEC